MPFTPMTTLRVPMRDAAKVHLQRQAQSALYQIATTLRRARIKAKARVQFNQDGRGRVVVLVQGYGRTEAELLLRPWVAGFRVVVV